MTAIQQPTTLRDVGKLLLLVGILIAMIIVFISSMVGLGTYGKNWYAPLFIIVGLIIILGLGMFTLWLTEES